MAALEELRKKFHDHRRWAADLLLKKEEEIESLSATAARLTAQLEQVTKERLSTRQQQGITQPVAAGNTMSLLNGLGSSDESALPATVPYTEYADVVQKLNLYRRNIQEKDRTLKRLIEKYQNCKGVALAWEQYAARAYEKSKKRLAAATDVSGEMLPFSPIPSPTDALEMGLIPDDMESDASSTAGVTAQAGENHSQTADELRVAANSTETLTVVRVKEEPSSSPDSPNPSPGKRHRIETMDLNNVDHTADTPHRKKRMEAFLQRQQTGSRAAAPRRMRSNSEPFDEQPFPESGRESADARLRHLLPTLRRAESDPIINVEDEACDFISSTLRPTQNTKPSNEPNGPNGFHLLNSNQRVLPRTDDVSTRKKRRRKSDSRCANRIHLVAEDNDVSKKKRKSEPWSTGRTTDFNSRLTSLLHQPSPMKHHLSPNRPLSIVTGGVTNQMAVDKNSPELRNQVRVGTILQTTKEDELKTFFEEFGVKSVSFASDATSHPLTFAFVELSSSSEAQRAIATLNGQTFLGRKVSVEPATPTDCDPDALDMPSATTTMTKHRPEVSPSHAVREPSMTHAERDNQSRNVVTQKEKSNMVPTKQAKNTNRTADRDKSVSKESAETASTFRQPPRPASRIPGPPSRQPFPTAPLRKRPVSELQLSDFKLNPRANQGYDYAFVETARSREGRRQLHRCTNPNCCGATMTAIASESTTTAPPALTAVSQTPNGLSDENAQFLREYLGDAFNLEAISNMSVAQRDDLVFAARMKVATDRHGKHRCQHARHSTPPGFWRTDMPTTQELEHDRDEARRLERQKVEERWREASREGGLWLFRDES